MTDPSANEHDGKDGDEGHDGDHAAPRPLIDVSKALHTAGHEAELLGA